MTRRTLVSSLALTAALQSQTPNPSPQTPPRPRRTPHKEWKPMLGVLGPYTPANVEFAKTQGFTNMILSAGQRSTLDATKVSDSEIQQVKDTLKRFDMNV